MSTKWPLREGKELRLGLGLALSQALPAEIAEALVKDAKLSFSAGRNSAGFP